MNGIHSSAIIDPTAEVAADVAIGPFSIIEADVRIAAGCQIAGHVVIKRGTMLGENNVVSEHTVLGGRPQHLQAKDRVGRLIVGRGNTFREHVTVHAGFAEHDETTIGDGNLLMVNVHVGHDCHIGDRNIIANNVMLAGHVTVESRAYISGAVGIHQFCRVGQMAMVGGQAHISQDIPPYITVDGLSSEVVGLNTIGLRRNGIDDAGMKQLKAAYRVIYRSGLRWKDVLERLQTEFASGPAAAFYTFLSQGKRGFVQERRTAGKTTLKLYPSQLDEPPADEVKPPIREVG